MILVAVALKLLFEQTATLSKFCHIEVCRKGRIEQLIRHLLLAG